MNYDERGEMMKGKVLLKGLFVLVCVLMLSVSTAFVQAQPCPCDEDGDGSAVCPSGTCDAGDSYSKCTITEEACDVNGDCPSGQCSETGAGCTVTGDCPANVCNFGGAECVEDSDCSSRGETPGVCEAVVQTCDAVSQTCDAVSTCSRPPHATDIDCTVDADCNGICAYTGEVCSDEEPIVACSYGWCIPGDFEPESSVCEANFTCSAGDLIGDACKVDADCDTCEDNDNCPEDPDKTEPGECGCGVPEAGVCGCGVPDTDSDGDGTPNCIDNCPTASNPDQADSDGDGKGDVCDVAAPTGAAIPTLGEWGMITLGLLFLAVGMIAIVRRRQEMVAK
jgi:hypothetical protein